jgi:hypothetical protein
MRNSIKSYWHTILNISWETNLHFLHENSFKTKVETQAANFIKIKAGLYEIGHQESTFALIMNW